MLDLKILQRDPEAVATALRTRASSLDVAEFTKLDEQRRSLISQLETLQAERNAASAEVARMKRSGEDAGALLTRLSAVSDSIRELEQQTQAIKDAVENWMLTVPNMPDASVPVGRDEHDNVEAVRWGEPPSFGFTPREHWDIGTALGGIDFERAGKITGARFAVTKGWAARLERALGNFFLDVQTREHGYLEVQPPAIANRKALTGTGNLPKFSEDLFKLEGWEYFLIPTAEVPLTNLHADEVLAEADLPLAYTAQTLCFRSEAGAYGKDTRGLIRMHQFTKVEMVRFSHPETSFDQLEQMRGHAESLLQRLKLPYRVVTLCTGDMGFSSCKTYDIEVWLPGQNTYREISSCSNCGDFQARRANIRFRPTGGGKPQFVHTLNGSGLPIGRTLVAILENYQQEDGSVKIPEVLVPYMDGRTEIR